METKAGREETIMYGTYMKLTVALRRGKREALQLLPTMIITVHEESSVNYSKWPGLMHRAESPRV